MGVSLKNFLLLQMETQIEHLNQLEKNHRELTEFLLQIKRDQNTELTIPIMGGLAFCKGVATSNRITMSLGDNWFAEMEIDDAIPLIERRLKFLESLRVDFEQKIQSLKELQEKLNGPEVNEDGEPFMEIRESIGEAIQNIPTQTENQVIVNDDFDQKLLDRIAQLELEEEKGVRFSDAVSKPTAIQNIKEPVGILKKPKSIPETISNDISKNTLVNSLPNHTKDIEPIVEKEPIKEKFKSPMSLQVVEHDFSDEEFSDDVSEDLDSDSIDSDDQIEQEIQAKEIQVAYHRKRQQLISAGFIDSE
jgi:prefoldin subunit 5